MHGVPSYIFLVDCSQQLEVATTDSLLYLTLDRTFCQIVLLFHKEFRIELFETVSIRSIIDFFL